jgi:hypothetical protein
MTHENESAAQRHCESAKKALRAHIRAVQQQAKEQNAPIPSETEAARHFKSPPPPQPDTRIHPEETELTLLLACAMKLFLAFRLTDETIWRAEELMHRYLMLYKKVSTSLVEKLETISA